MSSLAPTPLPSPRLSSAPKSLRVLGILSMVFASLSIALIIVLAIVAIQTLREFRVTPPYITTILLLNTVAVAVSLLELTAGIGMTCGKRWGRTLGLIYAFACIPVGLLIVIGFNVTVALASFALIDAGTSSGSIGQTKVFMGSSCLGSPFAIVLMVMLLSGKIRAWAKGSRTTRAAAPSAAPALAPPTASPVASPVAISTATVTFPADLPLSFPSKEPPRASAAAPITITADAPLAFAGTSPAAVTPPPISLLAPAAAVPVLSPISASIPSPHPASVPAPIPAPIPAPSPIVAGPSAQQSSRLSIAALLSLVFAFVPFMLVSQITSLILGIIGLKRIARSKGTLRGRGFAISGIIISSLILSLIVVLVAMALVIPALSGHTPVPPVPEPPVTSTNSLGMTLVKINPGTFMMGNPANEKGQYNPDRQHKVTLTRGFEIAACDVTVQQFSAFVSDANYQTDAERAGDEKTWHDPGFQQGGDHPVVGIDWNDAIAFCHWLSTKEDRIYTLPTEAQWEYACRAGTTTAFSFGDREDALHEYAWFDGNSGGQTHPVGQKKPNSWGLYDMHGLVWQLCLDWAGDFHTEDQIDPTGYPSGSLRVIRGGPFTGDAADCRSDKRGGGPQDRAFSTYSFRVVRLESAAPVSPDRAATEASSVTIRATVAGRIAYVVPSAARVSGGEILLRLDDSASRANLKTVESRLAAARAQVQQSQNDSDAADKLEAAQREVARLEAAQKAAAAALERCTIRAIEAGRIQQVDVDVGQIVQPGENMMILE